MSVSDLELLPLVEWELKRRHKRDTPIGLAVAHSKGKFQTPPHIILLNKTLLDVANGKIKRLIISMPPRHGKSETASAYFPAWYLGNNPDKKIILSSYEAGFASTWGARARDILTDSQDIFASVPINGYNAAASSWDLKEGGGMVTAGVGGPITGRGADIAIIDDPVKNAEEALSSVYREKAKQWYRSTLYTRLEPNAAIILIQTRWHEDDLAGFVQKEFPHDGWQVLTIPAIAEAQDILGRKEGEALWPERYPIGELEKIQTTLGSFWWASMYQQRPSPEGGGIIKREWFKYYDELPTTNQGRFWSWDCAVKKGEQNDYTAGSLVNIQPNGFFVERVIRGRWEYPEVKKIIQEQGQQPNITGILIEDKSSGQQLIQDLKKNTRLSILAFESDKDKIMRARLASPLFEAGKVLFPRQAQWLSDFEDEIIAFPNAAHDDQVDSITQILIHLSNYNKPVLIYAGGKNNSIIQGKDSKQWNQKQDWM